MIWLSFYYDISLVASYLMWDIWEHTGGDKLQRGLRSPKKEPVTTWQWKQPESLCRAAAQINTELTRVLPLLLVLLQTITYIYALLPTKSILSVFLTHPPFNFICIWNSGYKSMFPAWCLNWFLLTCLAWCIVFFRLQVFVQSLPGPRVERYVQRLLRIWRHPL